MHKKQKEAQRVVRKAVASAKRAITMRRKKAEAELLRLMETDDSFAIPSGPIDYDHNLGSRGEFGKLP